jgi:outer membrane immunogenic protein
MKTILLSTVAVVVLAAAPALAADLPRKAPIMKAPPPQFSWTGCYIGGHIGGLWGQTKWNNPEGNDLPDFIRVQNDDFSSFTGGGQIGCNLQTGQWVFGVEGDLSWTDVDSFVFDDISNRDEIFRTKFDWYGSVRGRLGLAFDRWLVYGTGGAAFSRILSGYENYSDSTLSVLQGTDQRRLKNGWVAGGGIEYALTNNWLIRAEGLYYDFGKKVVSPSIGDGETARTSFAVGRVGLSYKFGGPSY